jgi:histidinol-phosphate aminotransferase
MPMSPARAPVRTGEADQAVGQREPAGHQPGGAGGAHPAAQPRRSIPIRQHCCARALGAARHRSGADRHGRTGSDELLNLAAQGYAGPGDEVIYVRYGFSVYDIAARRCGATPVVAPDARLRHRCRCAAGHAVTNARAWSSSPIPTIRPAASCPREKSLGCTRRCRPTCCWCSIRPMANTCAPEDDGRRAGAGRRARERAGHPHLFQDLRPGRGAHRLGTGAPAPDRDAEPHSRAIQRSSNGQAMALAALADQAFVESTRRHNAGRTRTLRRAYRGAGQPWPAPAAERGELSC